VIGNHKNTVLLQAG